MPGREGLEGPEPGGVRRVAVVGTGLIGSGWAAQFLARGLEVIARDLDPAAEPKLRASVDAAWPALQRGGLSAGASRERLSFVRDLESAVATADFVQESVPEVEELKVELLARSDAAAPEPVLIASSSSGLLPTRLQARCRWPGRIVIGHPFNPVYLLPLVEVLGGEHTHETSIDRALTFYRWLGKHPLRVRREIEGYIADRLQEAMWREALHLVADGVATTAEIDAAILDGPGLRLAIMGPCLTFHLAGGRGGMEHMLEQFGPALSLPWTRLQAPALTDTLRDRMIDGTRDQAEGTTLEALERERDRCLIEILAVLAEHRERAR